jgi:hypothetical protein
MPLCHHLLENTEIGPTRKKSKSHDRTGCVVGVAYIHDFKVIEEVVDWLQQTVWENILHCFFEQLGFARLKVFHYFWIGK